MKEHTFTETYTKKEERTYVRLPFSVSEGIDRIEVSYAYSRFREEKLPEGVRRREVNIIDLGLYSPDGNLRGWSGSDRAGFFVAAYDATPGYRRGKITPGSWAVALGIYKVEESVQVSVTVRLLPKERSWLAGDLHMHTLNSDGVLPTEEVIASCRRAGLDFIALTDHNNTEQNTEAGNPSALTVISGMEYTNYRGHANFFFPDSVKSFTGDPLSNSRQDMVETFKHAKEAGAIISLNHTHCDFCPWEFGFEKDIPYDMVEVWNGPMKPSEMRAIAWWHGQLASGSRLPAVGGSDTHRIERFRLHGTPTTFVFSESRAADDILKALLHGRSFITDNPSGPRLFLTAGNAGIGEETGFAPGLACTVQAERVSAGDLLVVKDGQGTVLRWEVPFSGSVSYSFPVDHGAVFYRAELYRTLLDHHILSALTNPLYIR